MNRFRYWLKERLSWLLVSIWSGPLKGYRIGLLTGTRFVRGTYGKSEVESLTSLIRAGDVVLDVGAHIGYFSMLASKIVGSNGKVIAFEPLPLNLAYLRQHVLANDLKNVEIIDSAVGFTKGNLRFARGGGTGRGHLQPFESGDQSGLAVNVFGLDELFQENKIPAPNMIKMDIEGAEGEGLRGAQKMLTKYRPTLLLSTHGDVMKAECEQLLTNIGYEIEFISKNNLIARAPKV